MGVQGWIINYMRWPWDHFRFVQSFLCPSYIVLNWWDVGDDSIWRCCLTSIGTPIVEIWLSYSRLISTVRFPLLARWHLHAESRPFVNTLRSRLNCRHFTDDIFKCIFFNENVWISLKISLKFVPKVPINNNLALVQIMAKHRSGDKPLSEPMMVSSLMHICFTRPQ